MGVDYYKILEITRSATDAEINQAYRKLSLKYHPETNRDSYAADKFMEIAESYDVLSDHARRAVYDQFGEEGLKRGLPNINGDSKNWFFGYTFHRDAEKVFRDFFGGDNPFKEFFDCANMDLTMGFGGRNGRGARKQDPPIEKDLYLTLEEVFHGCTKKMMITKRILNKDGNSTSIHSKVLSVIIKKGWKAGTKIIFSNEGDEGPNCIPADIIFIVRDKPHPLFRREGNNLIHKAKISLGHALLGCTVPVHTLDERIVQIPINGIVKPGLTKVIHGEGMPMIAAPCDKGDLILEFEIEFPKFLPTKKKDLIRKALCVP